MSKASLHQVQTQGFSALLRRRRVKRHFERRPLLQTLAVVIAPAPAAGAAAEDAAVDAAEDVSARAAGQALLTVAAAGDVLAFSAGDIIPADCGVPSAWHWFVAQSAMTGESLPVEKFVEGGAAANGPTSPTAPTI